ncbi:unnamed protein product [Victoria cruziana]
METMVMVHLLSRHLYLCSRLQSPRASSRGKRAKSTPQHGFRRNTPYLSPPLRSAPHSLVGSSFLIAKLGTAVEEEVDDKEKNDFYVNLGSVVRTLREDMPLMFTKDLNYEIYREDITFKDPWNIFNGIENYKLIFSALRFHGRILFKEIWLEICKIWQLSENVILVRWTLHGIPRVPWESKGQFRGTSKYKLDKKGKIYEHAVDNLALNFPKTLSPVSALEMIAASCSASPKPTFFIGFVNFPNYSFETSSWLNFYLAVKQTLDQEDSQLIFACCR